MPQDSAVRRGSWAEDLAVVYLEAQGYSVLVRNFRCPEGEIDIVAQEAETLVFVEVRARNNTEYGHPLETIGPTKIGRIIKAAKNFVHQVGPVTLPIRFDALGIILQDEPIFELVKEAFEA